MKKQILTSIALQEAVANIRRALADGKALGSQPAFGQVVITTRDLADGDVLSRETLMVALADACQRALAGQASHRLMCDIQGLVNAPATLTGAVEAVASLVAFEGLEEVLEAAAEVDAHAAAIATMALRRQIEPVTAAKVVVLPSGNITKHSLLDAAKTALAAVGGVSGAEASTLVGAETKTDFQQVKEAVYAAPNLLGAVGALRRYVGFADPAAWMARAAEAEGLAV